MASSETPLASVDELLTRAKHGDEQAAAAAFDVLYPIVRRYCAHHLMSHGAATADVDDVSQETLLKMFQRLSDYDASRPAVGWALAFAYWECRTARSSKRRSRAKTSGSDADGLPCTNRPDDLLMEREQRDLLQAALADLDASELALLGLLPSAPVSSLSVSPAAIRKRKQRALLALKQAVQLLMGRNSP